jgi:hypothetical protein
MNVAQPMTTFALLETAKRLLSAEIVRIMADNVVICDRFGEVDGEERFQGVHFSIDGNAAMGLWAPSCDWQYPGDIPSGTSGQFYFD